MNTATHTGLQPSQARAVAGIGAGAMACSVFRLVDGRAHVQFVNFGTGGVIVLLVLGAAAVVSAFVGRAIVVAIVGVLFLTVAVIQLVQLFDRTNWFDGNATFFSLTLGFGVGLVAIGLTELLQPAGPARS
ncbi:MAG TPA: hypothetical protein VHJ79_11365 [Mycobacterium sp.]|nr:hypothetical protein [Mycobacterium sp.]